MASATRRRDVSLGAHSTIVVAAALRGEEPDVTDAWHLVWPMTSKPSIVRYSGTFRFRDRALLEQSLERARARIDAEQELAALEGGWIRCFVMLDNILTVNVALPGVPAHQDAAVEVFSLLSREAMDGTVTATMDNVAIEHYSVRARVANSSKQAPE